MIGGGAAYTPAPANNSNAAANLAYQMGGMNITGASVSPNANPVNATPFQSAGYQGGYGNQRRSGPGGNGFNNGSFTHFNKSRAPYNNGGGYNPSFTNAPPKTDATLNEWGRPAGDWGRPTAPDDELER